jgi:hypothetical protein
MPIPFSTTFGTLPVFAIELPLSEEERQVLKDTRAMGREGLGSIFLMSSLFQ